MKLLFPCLLVGLILAFNTSAQIQEDFSDGDFTGNPAWQASAESDWLINSSFQLQSNRMIPNSSFWISSPQTLSDSAQWELNVFLNANPSSVNYIDVYMMSSRPNPNDNELSGYFIRIGNTDDEISLYRKDPGNKMVKIIDGENGLLNKSSNAFRLKVIRRKKQEWFLYYDASLTGNEYQSGGQTIDQTYQSSQYFIIQVQQSTSSFFRKHVFDDISVKPFMPDTTAPKIQTCRIESADKISIRFSETMNRNTVEKTSHYDINNGIGHPKYIFKDSSQTNRWTIVTNELFESGKTYQVLLKDLEDESGNFLTDTLIELVYYKPKENDIVINEILFDPKGSGADYIELYNRSAFPINLRNVKLANRNLNGTIINLCTLFSEDYLIATNDYLVLSEDILYIKGAFNVKYPEKLIELSRIPSMPNDQGTILLLDAENNHMDELSYSEDWHFPLLDLREGVSLERIHPHNPTQDPDNWMSASKTSGYGTPTVKNSQLYSDKSDKENIHLSGKIFSPDQDGQSLNFNFL